MTSDLPYPLLGLALSSSNSTWLDLSKITLEALDISPVDIAGLSAHIYTGLIRYGGYLEKRNLYAQHQLFDTEQARDIHLGVDVWAREGAVVHAPWPGTVISSQDNAGEGDYGPTLIIEHRVGQETIHALYGHLSRSSLYHNAGDRIERGAPIAVLGSALDNGGWLPHLHLQLIKDPDTSTGDYPGVCAEIDLDFYSQNCPNPADWGLIPHHKEKND